ncbi:MAG: glycosyltransferase family 39 protein [Bacteroidota bacterium]
MTGKRFISGLLQRPVLLFSLLGAIFFLPWLGEVHLFDWDEINFAEAAREMILLEDYLRVHINFQPFWEKPPLFFWLQVLAMKGLGIGEYAARLPNAICGILTLGLLVRIGQKLYDSRFGIFWALSYFGSVLPHLYFKSGIIDPWFNLFIFAGLYLFVQGYWKRDELSELDLPLRSGTYFALGGLVLGLAVLTKGPVAGLIIGLVLLVYWIKKRFRLFVGIPQVLLFAVAALFPFGLWLGIESWKNGSWFITEFTTYQIRLLQTKDAGHGGFLGYHVIVLLIGCFPASIFALKSLLGKIETGYKKDFRFWMLALFWVVLILFSLVQSKIIHYSSLCYFPLTYLSALTLYRLSHEHIQWNGILRWGLYGIGGLYALLCISAPILANSLDFLEPLYANDPSAVASIRAEVPWSGWEFIPGVCLLALMFGADRLFLAGSFNKGSWTLFGGSALFVILALIFYVNKVESYSQRAAIEHWEQLQGKDCYVAPFSYKSYAPYFYGQVPPSEPDSKAHDINWLLFGEIDKDVYITTKIHRLDRLVGHVPDIEEIGRKNGFVFLIRKKKLDK